MPRRIMYLQLKTGYNTDRGPSWIAWVRFSKTWRTAYVHGRELRRWPGLFDANFVDVETGEEFWLSGPKRDRTDGRYSNARPLVESDAAARYDAFLAGAPAAKLAD
ncbi:hypothetical protein [Amycolatopsis sp. NPDC051716]|uniref:hypothetical protein n=1 Tax=Amycolatopsis sp. NPDC051716 TaxID=3155804 RepID=UPI00343667D8